MVHGNRKHSQIRFVPREDNLFDRGSFRRNDFDLSVLEFSPCHFQADLHRRFDVSHAEGIGDVLPRHPWIVKKWKIGLLLIQRRNIFEQDHLGLVADVEMFEIGDGLIIIRIDEVFLANDRSFSLCALLGDEAWQIFGHTESPL